MIFLIKKNILIDIFPLKYNTVTMLSHAALFFCGNEIKATRRKVNISKFTSTITERIPQKREKDKV